MARMIFLLSLCLFLSPGILPATPGQAGQSELRVGIISPKPQKRLQEYTPLALYLTAHLKQTGIRETRLVVTKTIDEMQLMISKGAVDVIFESALSTIEMEKTGMVPSLLAWRKGVREYKTLFFVHRNSSVRTLAGLRGKTIAFEDQHSTSAFAVPVAEMKHHGLAVMPAEDGAGRGDAVKYSFAGEALNEAYWVAQGRTDAAAFSNNDWDELPAPVRSKLRIIHETRPILRFIVSFHPGVPGPLRSAIEDVLIDMDQTEAGRKTISSASDIKKVDRLNEADRASLQYVRELMKLLNANEAGHQ